MPRLERRANIGTGIWSEPTIRALTRRQRDAYLLAYTQPDVSRCGVLTYRLRYWSGLAADSTETELAADYRALTESRHVILDERDELLLLRTYVKHDGLLTQPLVVASMLRDYRQITSPLIRTAFLTEMRRLWDDPDLDNREHQGLELTLGANPTTLGMKQPEKITTAIGSGLLAPLIEAIRTGHVAPYRPEGLPEGLTEGQLKGLTEGLPGGMPEGQPDPRENARTPVSCPVPATAPVTVPATASTGTDLEPVDDPTGQLLTEHINSYTQPPPLAAQAATRVQIQKLIAEGIDPPRIRAGLTRMRNRGLAPRLLPETVTETTPVINGKPSTADQRVGDALALAAKYDAQEATP